MQIHNQIFLYAFASLLKLNLPLIFHGSVLQLLVASKNSTNLGRFLYIRFPLFIPLAPKTIVNYIGTTGRSKLRTFDCEKRMRKLLLQAINFRGKEGIFPPTYIPNRPYIPPASNVGCLSNSFRTMMPVGAQRGYSPARRYFVFLRCV
uniref:SJCHGC03375 protein n=1 Tax=Schistosoma japonicum TaxID=6182 RepID=Q5DGX3_SCHJA|nr:SJCHGC03375 protein [Schistosoma japonicum]